MNNKITHSIPGGEHEHPGLRFDELFERGILLAQKFSGDHWTDYNYHDPGVTMLEYLVYALMDLTFRTKHSVEDLFLIGTDQFDNIQRNMLYLPHDVFPSDPYTPEDYRKMIIDQVKLVKNAWVNPVFHDPAGHKGLFEILIQGKDDLDELEKPLLEREIRQLFHRNRNLGHDLASLKLLKNIPLTLVGDIHIETDAVAEVVMAKVYTELDQYINPEVRMESPFDLIAAGHGPETVFQGPKPVHGVIRSEHLKPKTDAVYVSRIRNLIARIDGVKSVGSLSILRKGLPVQENLISFDADSFPSIEFKGLEPDYIPHLRLFKNNIEQDVDAITAQQLIDFDLAERRTHYMRRLDYPNTLPKGNFSQQQLMEHFAIHNEFPETYAIGRQAQPDNPTAERQALTKQLKTYLTFFEQIMANHLSQLAHIRDLMSIATDEEQTYYTQSPSDIDHLQDLLIDPLPSYEAFLKEIANPSDEYFDRRNRILDHLLARYGEQIDQDVLRKFALQNHHGSEDKINREIIQTKINYLRHIVVLSRSRNISFNYLADNTWNTDNISRLEWKLFITLNFRHHTRRGLVQPLLDRLQMRKTLPDNLSEWQTVSVELGGIGKTEVMKLPLERYQEEEIQFPDMKAGFVQRLFANGTNPKYLRVVAVEPDANSSWAVLFRCMTEMPDIIVYQHASQQKCEEIMSKFVESVKHISAECEGFHLVEHLLLRPLEPKLFTFNLLDEKGEVLMTGYQPGSLEQQALLSDELPVIGAKSENYSVISDDGSKTFGVVLYDANYQPVARLRKTFHSRVGAEKALEKAGIYLKKILDRSILLEQVLEINNTSDKDLEVPDHFEFSNKISIVLPNWPTRFGNDDFLQKFKEMIRENIPAHFTADIFLLDPEILFRFEDLYSKWLKAKASVESTLAEVDQLATRLIQLLVECKTNGLYK